MNLRNIDHNFDEFTIRYIVKDEKEIMMILLPNSKESLFEFRDTYLDNHELAVNKIECPAWTMGSLAHVSISTIPQGKGAGSTLKHGNANRLFHFASQDVSETHGMTVITTKLQSEVGWSIEHRVEKRCQEYGVEVITTFVNESEEDVTLDMLTSFSLDGLSPLQANDSSESLYLHRFRSGWSLEGKHIVDSIESLGLERTWYNQVESERFGGIGSWSARKFFPLAVIEDQKNNVFWAASLAYNASWQMELSHESDTYSFSGGVADREFGTWRKRIAVRERYEAPKAYLTVAEHRVEEATNQLLSMYQKYVETQPAVEQDLPIVFNEWCTSWGKPSEDKMLQYLAILKDTSIKYFVIDAGWPVIPEDSFSGQGGNGDWILDKKKFPQGLLALSRKLKEHNKILGVWFEFEVTTKGALVYEKEYDSLHLTNEGQVINTGGDRTFWDFRKPEVIQILKEKVIDFVVANEIGYVKVDYNGSIGQGCDGAESLGSGLQEQMLAVRNFFLLLRQSCPDLVIENCASGGNRLEPMMMNLTAMSSATDAHECLEIPYLVADILKAVLPRQCQVWSVVQETDNKKRLEYSLSSAFLGRFCLSGAITKLDDWQLNILKEACLRYKDVTDILKDGYTYLYRDCSENRRYLRGLQCVVIENHRLKKALLICHQFGRTKDENVRSVNVTLPDTYQECRHVFGEVLEMKRDESGLVIEQANEFAGSVYLMI